MNTLFKVGRAAVPLLASATLLFGCAVGKDYKRPTIETPVIYRDQIGSKEAASFANLPWWDVFQDKCLLQLISKAVTNNLNLQVAAARVEQARAQVGVAQADFSPQINYQMDGSRSRNLSPITEEYSSYNLWDAMLNATWELDVWGRIRRSTEAARANLLSTEEFRRGVLVSLVGDVAEAYLNLLALDQKKSIALKTIEAYRKTVEIFERQYSGGANSKLPVERAKANLADAKAVSADLDQQIATTENQICVLLGTLPGPIERGSDFAQKLYPPDVPAGLPSELLERRPDIRQAEANLMAANALVGVAMANFFPKIGLTALFGDQSKELDMMFKKDPMVWNFGGTVAGPLFQGGRLRSQYKAQVAVWEQAKLTYQQTVLQAFADVSSILKQREVLVRVRGCREDNVTALRESVRLSTLRFELGMSGYYEVLEAQQQLFPAENNLVTTIQSQYVSLVKLYRALGGGWQSNSVH